MSLYQIYSQLPAYNRIQMEPKTRQFKLPTIPQKSKQSSRVLSNTLPDNMAKLRPSSLNKVDDLQKKLFSKLDAYQTIAAKKAACKKIAVGKTSGESFMKQGLEGYEKMQKRKYRGHIVMPELYSRLVQAKKGSMGELPLPTTSQNIMKGKEKMMMRRGLGSAQLKKRQEKETTFMTQGHIQSRPNQISIEMQQKQQGYLSDNQMEAYFRQYLQSQNLHAQTSSSQLQAMSESLVVCQRQIDELTHSMQSLIRQIGMQCVNMFESQSRQDQIEQ